MGVCTVVQKRIFLIATPLGVVGMVGIGHDGNSGTVVQHLNAAKDGKISS